MARRKAPKASARDRVLDAALELFVELGYKGTTTRAIAARARVNEVTVFRQFGTKQGLFHAVVLRETDIRDRLEGLELRPSDDMAADLARFGTVVFEGMGSRSTLLKLILSEVGRDPALWEHVSQAPFGVLGKLEGYFRQAKAEGLMGDVDPHLAATAYFSFFFRSMIARSFLGRDVFIDMDRSTVEGFARIFVDGIRRRS
jgi:AcrR family transcriptional regulator